MDMSTTMEPELILTIALLTLQLIALFSTLSLVKAAPKRIMNELKPQANQLIQAVSETTVDLTRAQARAAGTMRTLNRRTAEVRGEVTAEDGSDEIEVPDALVNIAKGAGIDLAKVLGGDAAEMAKAKAVLGDQQPPNVDMSANYI